MSRHRLDRRPRRGSRRRPALVVGLVLLAAALVTGMLVATGLTSAAFTDTARLSTGVGSTDVFDVVLVDADGIAHQAPAGAALSVPLPDGDLLVPGRTVETTLTVAANHPAIAAGTVLTLDAERVPGTPDITPFVRFSVLGEDRPGVSDVTGGTPVDLGRLAARGGAPIADGTPWEAGAAGSSRTVTIAVHLLDDPATETLNGGQVRVTARLDATSQETA
jgi:hypothetical protein